MNSGRTVFAQLMTYLPMQKFNQCVARYQGDFKVRSFTCLEQFLCMAFAQLTYRESLRDIEVCLRAVQPKLYHMGIRSKVSRSTLADANENRDWRIYADFAQVLISIAKPLYATEDFGVELDGTAYALDASTIDLCLSLFPWARFRDTKGAVKLHTLMNLRGNIPEFIYISDGKMHDVKVLDILIPEPGSFYIMDRGYVDYARLYKLHQASASFVTRAKSNFTFRRLYSNPVDKASGLRSDQTVVLTTYYAKKDFPDKLRRIVFLDSETGKRLTFLTNNFTQPALTITMLYKARWQIELFFKWIKQHLRIKAFYGTSLNAVKTQIWIAISVYVLVSILKKRLNLEHSLYTILQILSVIIVERIPILQAFREVDYTFDKGGPDNQLLLFS
jgi:transposase